MEFIRLWFQIKKAQVASYNPSAAMQNNIFLAATAIYSYVYFYQHTSAGTEYIKLE